MSDYLLTSYIKILSNSPVDTKDNKFIRLTKTEDGTILGLSRSKRDFLLLVQYGDYDLHAPRIIISKKKYPDLFKKCLTMEGKSESR